MERIKSRTEAASQVRVVNGREFLRFDLETQNEEHRQAETLLRVNQARLELLIKSANVGLWEWNLINNEVFFSREWKSQLGYGVSRNVLVIIPHPPACGDTPVFLLIWARLLLCGR